MKKIILRYLIALVILGLVVAAILIPTNGTGSTIALMIAFPALLIAAVIVGAGIFHVCLMLYEQGKKGPAIVVLLGGILLIVLGFVLL